MTPDKRNIMPGIGLAIDFQKGEYVTASAAPIGENVLCVQVNPNLPYRYVAAYVEPVLSNYNVAFNYFIRGTINFYSQGRPAARLPFVTGINDSAGIADILGPDTFVNLFPWAIATPRQWSVILSNKFRKDSVVLNPTSLVMSCDEVSASVLQTKATPVTLDGYRIFLGCLSSSNPLP